MQQALLPVPEAAAAQLKARLLSLCKVAPAKGVEAKIHGGIRPGRLEKTSTRISSAASKQVLDRVLKLVGGSAAAAWEPLDDGDDRALTPVQAVPSWWISRGRHRLKIRGSVRVWESNMPPAANDGEAAPADGCLAYGGDFPWLCEFG